METEIKDITLSLRACIEKNLMYRTMVFYIWLENWFLHMKTLCGTIVCDASIDYQGIVIVIVILV